jgi:hypothetical protein
MRTAVLVILLLLPNWSFAGEDYIYGLKVEFGSIVQLMVNKSKRNNNNIYCGVKVVIGDTSPAQNKIMGPSLFVLSKSTMYEEFKVGQVYSTTIYSDFIRPKSLPTSYSWDENDNNIVLPYEVERGNHISAKTVRDKFMGFDYHIPVVFRDDGQLYLTFNQGVLFKSNGTDIVRQRPKELHTNFIHFLGMLDAKTIVLAGHDGRSLLIQDIETAVRKVIDFKDPIEWARTSLENNLVVIGINNQVQIYNKNGEILYSGQRRPTWIPLGSGDLYKLYGYGYAECDIVNNHIAYTLDKNTIHILRAPDFKSTTVVKTAYGINAFKIIADNMIMTAREDNKIQIVGFSNVINFP